MTRLWIWVLLAVAPAAMAQPTAPGALRKNEGQVVGVDKAAQEITIRHGYLPEIDMDPMTMVFNVADPALLARVKKGDRVQFKAGLVNGRFAVISINPVKPKRKEKP
jgi:Cu(I)/Ag(I) efflux system protein CusF